MSFASLEFGGFVDHNGKLGRLVPSGQIVVPEKVWIEGDDIRWRMGNNARLQTVSKQMLNQFVRLTDANSILHFAMSWGVLALSGGRVRQPGCASSREGSEPIRAWQYYSHRAQAVLEIAAALNQNKLGDLKDWDWIGKIIPRAGYDPRQDEKFKAAVLRPMYGMGFSLFPMDEPPEQKVEIARGHIAAEIGQWLDCWKREKTSGVSDFGVRWNAVRRRWELQIDYHGLLFPAIALQLALVVADVDSLFTCSGCGAPYIRPRERKRPKSGWANYCDECSKHGVAKRRAVESYRQKKAEAARMHANGMPFQEIAAKLHTKGERVRGWVKKG